MAKVLYATLHWYNAYMTKTHPPVHQIELRIVKLSELFNSMDPTPFHHRDLDADAEEFL